MCGYENYNPLHTSENYLYILAAEEVCWNAREWEISTNYAFNAPVEGVLAGVRLVHTSGWTQYSSYGMAYFGSGSGAMLVQLVRIMDDTTFYGETYYPKIGGMDPEHDTVHAWEEEPPCGDNANSHGCDYRYYQMKPYVLSTEPTFEWMEPRYNVTMDMIFMLVDGETCCQTADIDDYNDGTSCAQVWFIYE